MDEEKIHFKDPHAFRHWLKANHARVKCIWVIYYNKSSGKQSMTHLEGVAEALCFGWIDSTVHKLDEQRYMQRYSPRNPDSVWSLANKKVALKLIREGRMTEAGMAKIRAAKRSGMWAKAYVSTNRLRMPPDLGKALRAVPEAWKNFDRFPNSQRTMYIGWVQDAKKKETRQRRIAKVVQRSKRNLKIGMGPL